MPANACSTALCSARAAGVSARVRVLVTPTASCGGYRPPSAVMPHSPTSTMPMVRAAQPAHPRRGRHIEPTGPHRRRTPLRSHDIDAIDQDRRRRVVAHPLPHPHVQTQPVQARGQDRPCHGRVRAVGSQQQFNVHGSLHGHLTPACLNWRRCPARAGSGIPAARGAARTSPPAGSARPATPADRRCRAKSVTFSVARARTLSQLSGPPSAKCSSVSTSASVNPRSCARLMNRTRGTASAG